MQDVEDVEKALETAHLLFQDQSGWLQPHRRVQILEKAASIVEARVDELTKTAAAEGGKPYKDSKIEVLRAVNGIKVAAAEIAQDAQSSLNQLIIRPFHAWHW